MPDIILIPLNPSGFTGPTIYGFTSASRIAALYGQYGYDNIFGDLISGEEEEVIKQFISDAEYTVIVRLSKFYNPADMLLSGWVQSRTTWIAAHLISTRRGNEHYFIDLYEKAIQELEAMATGELAPDSTIPFSAYTTPSMTNMMIDDAFHHAKLRAAPMISTTGSYPGQHIVFGFFWRDWV